MRSSWHTNFRYIQIWVLSPPAWFCRVFLWVGYHLSIVASSNSIVFLLSLVLVPEHRTPSHCHLQRGVTGGDSVTPCSGSSDKGFDEPRGQGSGCREEGCLKEGGRSGTPLSRSARGRVDPCKKLSLPFSISCSECISYSCGVVIACRIYAALGLTGNDACSPTISKLDFETSGFCVVLMVTSEVLVMAAA